MTEDILNTQDNEKDVSLPQLPDDIEDTDAEDEVVAEPPHNLDEENDHVNESSNDNEIEDSIEKSESKDAAKSKHKKKGKKEIVSIDDIDEQKKSKTSIKGEFRKHGVSTGILIVWLVAIAVICIFIGAFAGAIWQHGQDERSFSVERDALNEKIATLQSKAEEDQKELAELREFRKKLEDLVTEYMVLDAQRQQQSNANAAANANASSPGSASKTGEEGSSGKSDTTSNSTKNSNTNEEESGIFDFLLGGDDK